MDIQPITALTLRLVLTALNLSLTHTPVSPKPVQIVKASTQQTVKSAPLTEPSYNSSLPEQDPIRVPTTSDPAKMRICQVNLRSYNTSKNLLQRHVDRNHIDLVAASETWEDGDTMSFKNWQTKDLFKNRIPDEQAEHGGGAALLAAPHVKIVPRKDLDIYPSLEVVWAQTKIGPDIVTICSAYIAPEREDHFNLLIDNLKYVNRVVSTPILLLGDINARSYSWESWHPSTRRKRYDQAFKRGNTLVDLTQELCFTVLNNGQCTRIDYEGKKSSPDLSIILGNLQTNPVWRVDTNSYLNTDHFPIMIDIKEQDYYNKMASPNP